ncbi:hypothetical protein [Burkholderia multivorans]|uniref:hypothetical protein n=2 Tax=Burkholderia multivorans TaxID=87883 RepID=UPI000F7A3492|nr:hypothetical protein [Burkholderia multivorans]RSB74334.1 hypothetical protein EGT33_25195 [Burkholderia multivorans]
MDEREMFEAWAMTLDLDLTPIAGGHYSDCNTDFAWLAWCAARRTTPDREAIIEECAKVMDDRAAEIEANDNLTSMTMGRIYRAEAERIRALKTAPTSDQGEKS